MRAERYHQECVNARPDHRPTGRESVRSRARGCGNKHPVAGPARKWPAIYLHQPLEYSLPRSFLDRHLVDCVGGPFGLESLGIAESDIDGESLLNGVGAL